MDQNRDIALPDSDNCKIREKQLINFIKNAKKKCNIPLCDKRYQMYGLVDPDYLHLYVGTLFFYVRNGFYYSASLFLLQNQIMR